MKAMRRRLALPTPKAFASPALPATAGRQCEIPRGRLFLFCEAFGVRTRPRVALTHCHYIVVIDRGVPGEIRMISVMLRRRRATKDLSLIRPDSSATISFGIQ